MDTRIGKEAPHCLSSHIRLDELDLSKIRVDHADHLLRMYLSHRFDLLGSGWVEVGYGTAAFGLEGHHYAMNIKCDATPRSVGLLERVLRPSHLKGSMRIWKHLVDTRYSPIDWQKDFKSGFSWDTKRWYKDQRTLTLEGADIKVPWELARLQHLPQMALLACVSTAQKKLAVSEFRNIVLDFISTNPPRMGVNWACTMDVAIRAANLLLAFDLFSQIDEWEILDKEFCEILADSIYEHDVHIIRNLEYSDSLNSNHYLSNVAGLLFISAYLEKEPSSQQWLSFSFHEIIAELFEQFKDDGSNFEGSTSYHRLSGELVVYSLALFLGLDNTEKKKEPEYSGLLKRLLFPSPNRKLRKLHFSNNSHPDETIGSKLFTIGEFTSIIRKPTSTVPQIGDNDSGRFFKLTPVGGLIPRSEACKRYLNLESYISTEKLYWDENVLDHTTFLSALSGLVDSSSFIFSRNEVPLEHSVIISLAQARTFPYVDVNRKNLRFTGKVMIPGGLPRSELEFHQKTVFTGFNHTGESLTNGLQISHFPDFGLVLFKSKRLYLAAMCLRKGQKGLGGHNHNDLGALELNVDGTDIIGDPGTYLYTPLAHRRNQFRSTSAHAIPTIRQIEQSSLSEGLFTLVGSARGEFLSIEQSTILMKISYNSIVHLRLVTIQEHAIVVDDYCNEEFQLGFNNMKVYSNGYGKLISLNSDAVFTSETHFSTVK